jgi:hypothetical protein
MDSDDRNAASAAARVLAPAALVGTALLVVIVIASSLGDSNSDDGGERGERRQAAAACKPSDEGRQARKDGYYVIQPGEPGLSAVADKTCVPVDELQRLNPDLDPQLIPQGGCVDLRRDGCKALAEG